MPENNKKVYSIGKCMRRLKGEQKEIIRNLCHAYKWFFYYRTWNAVPNRKMGEIRFKHEITERPGKSNQHKAISESLVTGLVLCETHNLVRSGSVKRGRVESREKRWKQTLSSNSGTQSWFISYYSTIWRGFKSMQNGTDRIASIYRLYVLWSAKRLRIIGIRK